MKIKKAKMKIIPTKDGGIQMYEELRGKKHGTSIVIKGEVVIANATFQNDKLHGVSEIYTDDGLIREFACFKKGKKHGLSVSYCDDKNLIALTEFDENNMLIETAQIMYFENNEDSIEQKNAALKKIFNEKLAA